MVTDICDLVRNKNKKAQKHISQDSASRFNYPLREELSNFFMLAPSKFSQQELQTFEFVIAEIVKTNLLAEEQIKQSLSSHEISASFLYYVDNDFYKFDTSESFVDYLYNDSKFARSLVDAFQDNKKMRDVIFHFMDTAKERLSKLS